VALSLYFDSFFTVLLSRLHRQFDTVLLSLLLRQYDHSGAFTLLRQYDHSGAFTLLRQYDHSGAFTFARHTSGSMPLTSTSKFSQVSKHVRVTRLGEFSPIGRLFSLGSFFKKYSNSPNFLVKFSAVKNYVHSFLFLRLPLDTGIRFLHLSGILWMFFHLFVLLSGNILPDIVDSLEVRISTHQ
jgi:hypothetical protein